MATPPGRPTLPGSLSWAPLQPRRPRGRQQRNAAARANACAAARRPAVARRSRRKSSSRRRGPAATKVRAQAHACLFLVAAAPPPSSTASLSEQALRRARRLGGHASGAAQRPRRSARLSALPGRFRLGAFASTAALPACRSPVFRGMLQKVGVGTWRPTRACPRGRKSAPAAGWREGAGVAGRSGAPRRRVTAANRAVNREPGQYRVNCTGQYFFQGVDAKQAVGQGALSTKHGPELLPQDMGRGCSQGRAAVRQTGSSPVGLASGHGSGLLVPDMLVAAKTN
eukprot:356690-Chlamydomonas_euryale.AAC.1